MKLIIATILGILEIVIRGPLDAVFGFFGWGRSLTRNVIDEIAQDQHEAHWKREFLADKQREKTSRNPFLNPSKPKSMQWGRSSQSRKSKP
jgi:hypothetical protein